MFGSISSTTRRQRGASKSHGFFNRLAEAVDAYAAYRMRRAVPEFELRRAERAISRYRQQMRHGAAH